MEIEIGDKIVDLIDDLGVGTVIDKYTNFHDSPSGELMYVCEFPVDEENEEPTVCDRLPEQIVGEQEYIKNEESEYLSPKP